MRPSTNIVERAPLTPVRSASGWLTTERRVARPRARVLCVPYAGGNASVFRGWSNMLADYEVWRVQPPGRPPRTAETPATDIEAWLAPIAHELQAWNDAPWCIYGHSMGALVAVEAAQRTIDAGGRAPLVAFVAACAAPHPDRRRARLSTLPEREFQHALERFGGTPPAILEDPALLTLLSGAVRADLAVLESHVPRALGSYEFPIVALAGTADRAVSIQEAETWRQCGKRQFRFYKIAGGHFFLQTSRAQVIECIQMELERFLD